MLLNLKKKLQKIFQIGLCCDFDHVMLKDGGARSEEHEENEEETLKNVKSKCFFFKVL